MGLFDKKNPCPICGGKVKGLFVNKIEGQHICYDCYGNTDLPLETLDTMSVDDFRAYIEFRKENDLLKQQFEITQKVNFGLFDTKFVFDMNKRLLCMNDSLLKTVFEGKQIKSFVIKEDDTPLFEGTAAGLVRYPSAVPDGVRAMSAQIRIFRMQQELASQTGGDCDLDLDLPEPFEQFNVEIHFDHPYWDVFTADMCGPQFDSTLPDIDDYLRDYREGVAEMETLARALMQVAFPDAPELTAAAGTAVTGGAAAPVDAVAEIQRYKGLMDQGVITEEEFAAKKKQLLGI